MTGSRTILQVGTHTTLHPIHGGQLRSHHIGRALEGAGYVYEALPPAGDRTMTLRTKERRSSISGRRNAGKAT